LKIPIKLQLSAGSLLGLLIAYTLIARRKNLLDLHSKWILFLGIAVLPVPAIFLSTAVGLEHSKQVKFCNSCHAMDPFIDDMKDVGSNRSSCS
jgi:nitrate/TMAO reductase-like tetraheme cytochrome c subunit